MNARRSRIRFYIVLYALSAIIGIAGLVVNVQTIPLNANIQKLAAQVKALRDENQDLKLKVLSETRLEAVDQIATDQLNMTHPETIIYIRAKELPHGQTTQTP